MLASLFLYNHELSLRKILFIREKYNSKNTIYKLQIFKSYTD